uniref:Uncharacterized protein n=1 Tax=Tanacetum cinerariifolium TaxID=118510 RepID=A0A6L2LMC3_TANCI|nr:hypothetical protein [Tanacetum cinerariifolium]
METQKSMLKDEDGEEVDVHIARNRQWLQIPQLKLNMWLLQVAVDKCFGFRINYLIMDGKKIIITEASIRRDLQLANEESVDCLPNSTIFEQLALMGKPTRKVTQVPQPSDPMEHVIDEAVHKKMADSLVRAATFASSLGAEQDSGGCPRCQETMEDTTAQTKFESVSKHFNDSLLARARVGSSRDEESLGEDASKQGRIDAIDADEYITLVIDQDDANKDMFDVNVLCGEEVFTAAGQNENVVIITTEELTLAQALESLKTSKPKVKGLVIQEQEPVKPKKKNQIMLDEEAAKRIELVKGKENRAGEELIQKSTKKQKVEDEKEKDELKQLMETISEEEEVDIDAIPLVVKSPKIVDWKIHKEGKKSYYRIIRVDGKF